jgi:hypothetical protein
LRRAVVGGNVHPISAMVECSETANSASFISRLPIPSRPKRGCTLKAWIPSTLVLWKGR